MKHSFSAMLAVGITAIMCSASIGQKKHTTKGATTKTPPIATPKQENQFVTVEEFVKLKKELKTTVSVEGYAAEAFGTTAVVKLMLVDSVDHVLSTTDADKFSRAGVSCTINTKSKATWAMTTKGLYKILMYTGKTHAEKPVNDSPAKIRITGQTAGKGIISPVTKVEYQNMNGDFVPL